jgi:hypothetical protein
MRQFISIVLGGVLLTNLYFIMPSTAWSSLRDEVRQFQLFLRDHPKISTELRNNPRLANNKKYLDKHDDLEKFLKRHPAVRSEIVHHPSRVFGGYYRDARNHR